jgi:diguanylate cyclase (GGDEF)-like protein/putative nucleotidyltransferase with HDIG domain
MNDLGWIFLDTPQWKATCIQGLLNVKIFGDKFRLGAALYAVVGVLTCLLNLSRANASDLRQFFFYLIAANVAVLGVRLAANPSLLPAGFLIMLLGVEDLSLPELLFIAFTATLLHELYGGRGLPDLAPLLFAVANITIGVASAQTAYQVTSRFYSNALFPASTIASSFVLLFNCGIATTLLRERGTPFMGVYRRECRPLLPWFVAAAYLAYLVRSTSLATGTHAGLIALPILFALDRGYRAWSDAKTKHAEELAALHQRTLETLSVAIDARDHTTHMHVRRVQFYARAVGKELGLSEIELKDLHVAALVHDIGKLGIPDHILLKPGALTAEEWEKMKTHPITGAEMLSRMQFPESVQAIVQTHHEKWDGSGYPTGLRGEAIPIGARILSAVDCLDALASDRPYRNALPLEEAMAMVRAESGKSYDPKVVSLLEQRYVELERQAWGEATKGLAAAPTGPAGSPQEDLGQLASSLLVESGVLDPIASARQETQLLQALANDLAQALHISDVGNAVHKRLCPRIGYDTLAIYVCRGEEQLEPMCILGENGNLFSRTPFPVTRGLSGLAVRQRSFVLNGDPRQEPGYANDSDIVYKLQSALAVPLPGRSGVTGVLTLYHTNRDAFSRDDLRLVEAATVHIGLAIENALRYQDAENLAVTDHLTGIPNARSLALHLERELSRAARENATVGVLVCDLNGFKQVNDRFGHLKGNEVLQLVANGLRDACRGSDYLARMGGDEFVIVAPGLRDDLCWSYAERLRNVALEAGWILFGERCLSMSVGAAIYPSDGHDSESLLAEADHRMYDAKKERKSAAVTVAPEAGQTPGYFQEHAG